MVIGSSQAHLIHVSTLSGPGRARIRPVVRDGQQRRWPPVPVSCRLSAAGLRFLDHPVPAGELSLPHGRPTEGDAPLDPVGVTTFHASEIRPGWVPPLLRDGDALPADTESPAGACRFTTTSPMLRWNIPPAEPTVTKHHQGFSRLHPSGLPLACGPRMERGPLGFSPELRTEPLPATHVGAGTGLEHWPGMRCRHQPSGLCSTHSLISCSIVSHFRVRHVARIAPRPSGRRDRAEPVHVTVTRRGERGGRGRNRSGQLLGQRVSLLVTGFDNHVTTRRPVPSCPRPRRHLCPNDHPHYPPRTSFGLPQRTQTPAAK
jgi:hypothetical protein